MSMWRLLPGLRRRQSTALPRPVLQQNTSNPPYIPQLSRSARFSTFMRRNALILMCIAVVLTVVAYGWALWRAPDWMHTHAPQDRYDARLLVISVIGGFVVGGGLLYTARTYQSSVRGQISDRFSKALERLGAVESYSRMGAIYSLEHVMHESPDLHNDIIEVLADFIRRRAPRSQPDEPSKPSPADKVRLESDVQAALTVLGRRPQRLEIHPIDLSYTKLAGALLFEANLRGAVLIGADLSHSYLSGADLSNANLNSVTLCYAQLRKTIADPDSDPDPDSKDKSISPGGPGMRMYHTGLIDPGRETPYKNLPGANLYQAEMLHADLTGAELLGARINMNALPPGWRVDSQTGLVARKNQIPM